VKVRYSTRATYEIAEIGRYIETDNPDAAKRVVREITRIAESLAMFPDKGRKQRARNTRRIGTPRYPYGIYYRVDETIEEVLSLTIRHTARRRPKAFQDR
jgi:toxin ParE1/3/4